MVRSLKQNSADSTSRKTTSREDDISLNEPIKFSQSEAYKWRAQESRMGFKTEMPWFQPYVISLSLAIFLLYFCVFREENDVDLKLTKNLYDHIEGLEEKQIKIRIMYNMEHNLSTTALEERLDELKAIKAGLIDEDDD